VPQLTSRMKGSAAWVVPWKRKYSFPLSGPPIISSSVCQVANEAGCSCWNGFPASEARSAKLRRAAGVF
jgi:hypothetical protein